ncbi:hypothetical protein SAMN05519104_3962 [Rhizobiales bacterium GAS188]|nr:hypothetical protein SAMN05519104_3962 [Rhizobiales bacterium GAS188]
MIIELFGPPCVGKTTLARHLATRLRERGHAAQLMLSYRPAEQCSSDGPGNPNRMPRHAPPTLRRLARPIVEMLALARQPSVISNELGGAINLVKMLRPKSVFWSIRLSQYLSRLSNSWRHASEIDGVMLFDQAFVQAICSLILLGRVKDEALIAQALELTPKPDLLIRIESPRNILEARLRRRQSGQSAAERLLEFDLQTNLELIEIVERVDALLRQRGRKVTCVASLEQGSLDGAAELIEMQLAAMSGTRRAEAVMR